jgi:hypothetical protein
MHPWQLRQDAALSQHNSSTKFIKLVSVAVFIISVIKLYFCLDLLHMPTSKPGAPNL